MLCSRECSNVGNLRIFAPELVIANWMRGRLLKEFTIKL